MRAAFDIDGTIADNGHREHLAREKRWDDFHSLSLQDKPLEPTLLVLTALANAGHHIEIWTARPDTYRADTVAWLEREGVPYERLLMRSHGDWRRAYILKLEWYLQRDPQRRPHIVFEDHPETTRLLRAAGACVHQVADRETVPS